MTTSNSKAIAKNIAYRVPSDYGELEITINLSKPEKDPKEIGAAKLVQDSNYPQCQLCLENEGLPWSGKPSSSQQPPYYPF